MVFIENQPRIRSKRRLSLANAVIAWTFLLFFGIAALAVLPLDANGLRIGGIIVLAVDAVFGLFVWRMKAKSTQDDT